MKDISPDYVAASFLNTITSDLKSNLRERIMEVLNPEINAIVNRTVEDLKLRIAAQRDIMLDRMVINLIQEGK